MRKFICAMTVLLTFVLLIMYFLSFIFNGYLYEMVKLNKELTVVSAIRVMVPVAIFIFYIWAHFIYHKDTY
ncbi:hypothetical protein, partial [Vibrio sp. 10N.222.46.A1]